METEDFLKHQHIFSDTIRVRKRDALLLRFSDDLPNKLRYSNIHMKIFDALDYECDIYRVMEQLMDRQLEMEELLHEYITWTSQELNQKVKNECERKRKSRDLKYNNLKKQ